MNRMMLIAFREYLENIRTKGFWIGLMMMPLVLLLVALVPIIVDSTRSAKLYAVIDESGNTLTAINGLIERQDFLHLLTDFNKGEEAQLPANMALLLPELRALDDEKRQGVIDYLFQSVSPLPDLSRRLSSQLSNNRESIRQWWRTLDATQRSRFSDRISTNFYRQVQSQSIEQLNRMIENEELFAYFILGADPVNNATGAKYVSNNLTDQDLKSWFSRFASQYVRDKRLQESNINETTADWINESYEFEGVKLGSDGSEEEVDNTDIARQWAPVAFVYFLWISVLINTQMLITNTIEEKSNKLIEVLLSSVSAITLMGGKIIGIAATGLTIVSAWLVMALAFFIGLPMLAGVELPIDLSSVVGDPWFILSFLMYFLLGYLFYAAMLVGLGSLCNNLKEAQNLIMPVQMIQMLPILLMVPIGRDPNGSLAQILSYVPPLTPFVMMNRAAGPPSTSEYVITTLLLIVSIIAAFWVAAKLFRIGILMTGKAPGPMEILRLLRAPVTRIKA